MCTLSYKTIQQLQHAHQDHAFDRDQYSGGPTFVCSLVWKWVVWLGWLFRSASFFARLGELSKSRLTAMYDSERYESGSRCSIVGVCSRMTSMSRTSLCAVTGCWRHQFDNSAWDFTLPSTHFPSGSPDLTCTRTKQSPGSHTQHTKYKRGIQPINITCTSVRAIRLCVSCHVTYKLKGC
jgi:hypothetical protein